MTGPQRIQRKRLLGWRLPEGATIVDRTSIFGNPFTVDGAIEDDPTLTDAEARAKCARMYGLWLDGDIDAASTAESAARRQRILDNLWRLAGRDLCCPCPLPENGQPEHCHGQQLLRRAAALKHRDSDATATA